MSSHIHVANADFSLLYVSSFHFLNFGGTRFYDSNSLRLSKTSAKCNRSAKAIQAHIVPQYCGVFHGTYSGAKSVALCLRKHILIYSIDLSHTRRQVSLATHALIDNIPA